MDITLNICIADGSEILIDGFDEISFYNELPNAEVTESGYSWQGDHDGLLNNLHKYNFIGISRHDPKDNLEYRSHSFAFQNQNFTKNERLVLRTNCVTTIINMYD